MLSTYMKERKINVFLSLKITIWLKENITLPLYTVLLTSRLVFTFTLLSVKIQFRNRIKNEILRHN